MPHNISGGHSEIPRKIFEDIWVLRAADSGENCSNQGSSRSAQYEIFLDPETPFKQSLPNASEESETYILGGERLQ